ncbi:MAG TPA: response regulator transcription factor [Candidatus Dojkabacteria bacterium]|nr:response regulator transcription factor [Candidatus Dojkabacteria bacterium]
MNILIIENSGTLAQIISKTLESYGYHTTLDNEDFESKNLVKKGIFDFVIINTNLGDKKSFEILEYIREKKKDIKVLGVCNKGNWTEKVQFLNKGGDDVLTYPFPMQELLARIQTIMRRPSGYMDKNLYIGKYVLDVDNRTVYEGNSEISVRKKEYDLLEYLVRNKDRVISRCELLDHVWDYREYVGSNTIDVHIKRLRDKLHDKNIIETVHGIGYKAKNTKKKN